MPEVRKVRMPRGRSFGTTWKLSVYEMIQRPCQTHSTTDILHPEIRATDSATLWPLENTEEVVQCVFPFPLLF